MTASLNSVLRKVLSVANKEANQHYPPHIYEEHFNITTDFIINECVRLYPENQSIVDVIRPFLAVKFDALKEGSIELPEDYRNLLGASVNTQDGGKKPCECDGERVFANDPLGITPEEFKNRIAKAGCEATDVVILDPSEFNSRTKHPYKKKRIKLGSPIGKMIGMREIKICPTSISHAEVFYVRKPKEYIFGYDQMPDDTYIFNLSKSVESEWDDTAFEYLFKGVNSLYAIYARDGEMRDWTVELKKIGLF